MCVIMESVSLNQLKDISDCQYMQATTICQTCNSAYHHPAHQQWQPLHFFLIAHQHHRVLAHLDHAVIGDPPVSVRGEDDVKWRIDVVEFG